MRIFLDTKLEEKTKLKIQAMLDDLSINDANFSGMEFPIYWDDSTWIESENEYKGTEILRIVDEIIQSDWKEQKEK